MKNKTAEGVKPVYLMSCVLNLVTYVGYCVNMINSFSDFLIKDCRASHDINLWSASL